MTAPAPDTGPEVLSSDKDLHRIHALWLGPQGHTLPFPIRYQSVLVAVPAFLVALPVLRAIGISGLWVYLGALVAAVALATVISRKSSSDRPLWALPAVLAHEISAPRPRTRDSSGGEIRPALIPVHHPGQAAVPPRPGPGGTAE